MPQKRHTYLTKFEPSLWEDLQRLKQLDGQSINSLIHTAIRRLVKERVAEIAQVRKTRTTLDNLTG